MKTDLVLSPFGADVRQMVEAARLVDGGGFDAVWTYDHISGAIGGTGWSRDPFVTLGAIAAVTSRVRLGVLVANMVNRHPAQLAGAVNSLQSLAPGRVLCGIGAGASPGSRFAVEHEAIGRQLADADARREQLVETIGALRSIWRGERFDGQHLSMSDTPFVTDRSPAPPIIVGATSLPTIRLAAEHADGVNIQRRPDLAGLVAVARRHAVASDFEVSVLDDLDAGDPLGGDPAPLAALGIDRRTLAVGAPYPLDRIAAIADELARRTE